MLEKLRSRSADEAGFTLVELLVVMLILGILAAIAIPAFFSQRDKGYDTEAKANTRTVQTALETYATDNNGNYTGATLTNLALIEPTITNFAADMVFPAPAAKTFSITGKSASGASFLAVKSGTPVTITYSCTPAGGGCPASLNWG